MPASNKKLPVPAGTPDELTAKLEAALKQIEELKSAKIAAETELDKTKVELKELKSEGSGWLITVPSPIYDGVTYGLEFKNGMAWVSETRKYEYGEMKKLSQAERKFHTPEEVVAADKKVKETSSAAHLVELLVNDMGYTATYYDGNDPDAIQKVKSIRIRQRQEAEVVLEKARNQAELLTMPSIVR